MVNPPLSEEVQAITRDTSEKYIIQPSKTQVLGDLLIGLKRFRNAVRWKEFFRLEKIKKLRKNLSPTSTITDFDFEDAEEDNFEPKDEGLGTRLKPNFTTSAPRGSDTLETFLRDLERKLLSDLETSTPKNLTKKAKEITKLERKLQSATNTVVILTDKTNSFQTISLQDYKKWVLCQLEEKAKVIDGDKLDTIYEEATALLTSFEGCLSEKEFNFVKYSLKSKAIPTPKLLIKDHKTKNDNGEFPTRLIIPATNFTAAFPKLGYSGIRKIFDSAGVNYMRKTIIQASDLKADLEKKNLNKETHTLASIDAIDMYPSINFTMVKKAVDYFSKNLPTKDKKNNC